MTKVFRRNALLIRLLEEIGRARPLTDEESRALQAAIEGRDLQEENMRRRAA